MHIVFLVFVGLLLYGLVYLVITHPMIAAGVFAMYGVGLAVIFLFDKLEKTKRIRVTLDVDKKYSEMSGLQRQRIVNAVMDGASLDEFSLEDGWLKRGQGLNARYAKSTGNWGDKQNYLDTHPLYAKEKQIVQKDFAKFNLSDAETHELCTLMYFNWVIVGVEGSPKELVVSLTRRGEHVFKRYSRAQVEQASTDSA